MDDSDFNIYALKKIIMVHGINTDFAYDGDEAIQKCLKQTEQPCGCSYKIIFMDVNMPIMNGYEST